MPIQMTEKILKIRLFKRSPYLPVWERMQQFTHNRETNSADELWLLEHEPVFTQGKAGKPEHILNAHNIPVVQSDRGGQVTYHGPGQLMAYTLFDVNRLGLNTRDFVVMLEKTIIDFLASYGIIARGDRDAPGVYVDSAKICSIGLRVRKGYSYHGIALNVAMDLKPFSYINPCGYAQLKMAQISDTNVNVRFEQARDKIIDYFIKNFGYNASTILTENEHAV